MTQPNPSTHPGLSKGTRALVTHLLCEKARNGHREARLEALDALTDWENWRQEHDAPTIYQIAARVRADNTILEVIPFVDGETWISVRSARDPNATHYAACAPNPYTAYVKAHGLYLRREQIEVQA